MTTLGVPNQVPTRYVGPGINIIPTVQAPREPLVSDKSFQLQTIWRVSKNPTTGVEGDEWILVRFESNGDATWRKFDFSGVSPGVDEFTTDDGPPAVLPDGIGNVNILGGAGIVTSGQGPGNTITISLAGGGQAIDEINVDAFTAPGTDPVVPDINGAITVTGGQVANGTVGANVIRTNSIAANTYTIEIQRSAVSALSDSAINGVSHYDSAQFTVDANGFVSITNFSPFNYVQIDDTDSPYVATSTDYYISCDSSGGTITIELPDAPTQFRMFTIKDRTASASANNITVTTVGGVVLIDGATTYPLASNFSSINLLFNGTSYEVF